jgi:hypothetical protein
MQELLELVLSFLVLKRGMICRIIHLVWLLPFLLSFSACASSVSSCCSILENNDALLTCVNDSTVHFGRNYRYEIVFAAMVSPEVYSYAASSMLFNSMFCEYRQYPLRILSKETGDDYYPQDRRWNKVLATVNALNGWASQSSVLVFIDVDLLILDRDFSVESLLSLNPTAHIILAKDEIDVANTGFLIVRNTPWSIMFMQKWWDSRYLPNTNCDQHVLNELIRSSHDVQSKVAVVPANLLNSRWPAIENYEADDPVLHLMGETSEVRDKIIMYAAQQLCAVSRSVSDSQAPSHKIGLTKDLLRSLKTEALLGQWEAFKLKCLLTVENSGMVTDGKQKKQQEQEDCFQGLHASVAQLCSPTKVLLSSLPMCFDLIAESVRLNHLSISTIHEKKVRQMHTSYTVEGTKDPDSKMDERGGNIWERYSVAKLTLSYYSHISMLLFDYFALLLYQSKVSQQGLKHVPNRHMDHSDREGDGDIGVSRKSPENGLSPGLLGAAQDVLQALQNLSTVLDVSSALNVAYLHHKRGVVFGSLSEHAQGLQLWESSLEFEKIAVSEFGVALEHTPQVEEEFLGYVESYVQSAKRLAVTFSSLQRLEEAYEWATISLHNLQLMREATSSEHRATEKALIDARKLCASICVQRRSGDVDDDCKAHLEFHF